MRCRATTTSGFRHRCGRFLRISTNRRVFEIPTGVDGAFAFIRAVIGQRGHVPTEPGLRHVTLVEALCREAGAVGDLVPDAVLGAIAVEHGASVATLDRDFARFDSVPPIRPGH